MNSVMGLLWRGAGRALRRATSVALVVCLCTSYVVAPVSAGAAKVGAAAAAAAKNQRPSAVLLDGVVTYAGLLTTVDGSGSSDADGTIVSYEWDFEADGIYDRTTTTNTTQYTFLATTQVILRVTDDQGATSTDRTRITVTPDAFDPVAVLAVADSALVDTAVLLDASGSYDTNGTIVSYGWDFDANGTIDATTADATTTYSWSIAGTYTVAVTVTDAVGKIASASDTIEITLPINLPPAAVTGVAAADRAGDEGGAVDLTWTASGEADFAHYHLYRSLTAEGGFALLPDEPASPSLTDTGLTDGVTYFYTVTAVDTADNESALSETAFATPVDNLAPSTPAGLSASDMALDSGDALVAEWGASPEEDVAGYRLTVTDTVSGTSESFDLAVPGTSYSATGLVAGRSYRFAIAAYDEVGNVSPLSAEVTASPADELPPAVPAGLIAEDRANDEGSAIVVTWAANSESDLGAYRVYRRVMPAGAPELIAELSGTTTVTDETCTDGVDYGYSVVALDTWGNMSAESPVVVARSYDWAPPLAVTSIFATDVAGDQGGAIQVFWMPSLSPDVVSHRVECLDANGVVVASATETTALDHLFTGLTNGGTYSFVVYASDAAGNESAGSPVGYAVPADNLAPAAPAAPAVADVAPDQGGAIAVSWAASTEADLAGYVVYCYDTAGELLERREVGYATGATFTGLQIGADYGFTVAALDVNGNESPASPRVTGTGSDDLAPDSVTATAEDQPADQGGAIVVRWSASGAEDLAGYRLLRDGGPIAELTALTYVDTVLDSANHTYAVVAFDASGNESAPSPVVVAAALDNIAPAPPSNLVVTDVPDDEGTAISVSFTPSPDEDVSAYCICYYAADGTLVDERHVAALDTEYVFYPVQPGIEYGFQVEAIDAAGNEGEPTARMAVTAIDDLGPTAPTVVTAVDAPNDEGGAIDVAWNPVEGAVRYEVWRGNICVMPTTGTSYQDCGLDNGVSYDYYVIAFDASGGASEPSELVTAVASDQLAPAAPEALQVLDRPDDIGTAIQLVWQAGIESDLAGFRVSRDGVQIADVTQATYLDTGLTNGRTYDYSVTAYDFSGNESAPVTGQGVAFDNHPDAGPPTVPGNVTAKVISYSTVALSWADSVDDNAVTGYIVEKRRAGAEWAQVAEVTTGWWVDKMCASSTVYEYRVTAIDAHFYRSAPSTPLSVTTPVTKNLMTTWDNYYANMSYTGPWTLMNQAPYSTSAFGTSVHYVDAPGAVAECTFTGSHITWMGLKGPNRGKADVYLDGAYQATVDCYSATMVWQQPMYSIQFGASGTHTLSIRYTGTKNALSTGYGIDVDAVQFVGAAGDLAAPGSPPGPVATASRTNVVLTWTVPSGYPSSYPVWRRVPGGAWTYLGAPTTNRHTDLTVTEGTTYEYMVTSLDDHGNMSGTSAITRTTTPLRVENTDPAIVYVGSWNLLNTGGYATAASGGSVMNNINQYEYAEYTFTGNKITWIALKGPDRGIADIYIDGGIMRSVDLYSAGYSYQQSLFTMTWSTPGVHTIRVQCSHRKNLVSTGYGIDLDAFEVTR